MNKIKQIKTDLKIIEITKDLNNINRIFTFCKKWYFTVQYSYVIIIEKINVFWN